MGSAFLDDNVIVIIILVFFAFIIAVRRVSVLLNED
jgi:hypothetical protein